MFQKIEVCNVDNRNIQKKSDKHDITGMFLMKVVKYFRSKLYDVVKSGDWS